jgi:hypothetical protein
MSFKTSKKYFSIDSINISFSKIKQNSSNSIYFAFPEFKNLTIFSEKPNITNLEIINTLKRYIYPDDFKILKKNTILNDTENQYVLDNIIYENFFSMFLPEIPLIKVIQNDYSDKNKMVFYKDKFIGVFVDEITIIPIFFLFNILINLILNNGIFIIDTQLKFDILETIDNQDNSQHFFLILTETIYIKTIHNKIKLSKGDIIFNINGNSFNKNGKVYSDKINLFLPLNTYLMLNNSNTINLNFLPISNGSTNLDGNHINCLNAKYIEFKIPIFNQTELKVPICLDDFSFRYNNLEFKILSEKLMETYLDCPISKKEFENNHISKNKYIVLTNHKTNKLYVLEKVSNKKIDNMQEMIEYINKIKNKKTFYFSRIDDELKITI